MPLNARLSLAEHARMLEETDCRLLVFGAGRSERAAAALRGSADWSASGSTRACPAPSIWLPMPAPGPLPTRRSRCTRTT